MPYTQDSKIRLISLHLTLPPETFDMAEPTGVHKALADHLSMLVMGFPHPETLEEILSEILKPIEAQTVPAISNFTIPLRPASPGERAQNSSPPEEVLKKILDDLAGKGFIFEGRKSRSFVSTEQRFAVRR